VIVVREVLREGLAAVHWRRGTAAIAAAGTAFAVALGTGALLDGLPALLAAGVLALASAAFTLWVLHHRQGLRLQELLPWHSSWGAAPPAPLGEPGQMA